MSDGEDEPKTSGFTIGWWNSHLTPPKGNKLPDLEKALVLATIEAMLSTINIFFLGEVDQEDMDWLDKNIGRSNLTSQFFQRHDGKFHKFSCYEVEFACFLHLTIFCPLETRHFTSFSMRLLI